MFIFFLNNKTNLKQQYTVTEHNININRGCGVVS